MKNGMIATAIPMIGATPAGELTNETLFVSACETKDIEETIRDARIEIGTV